MSEYHAPVHGKYSQPDPIALKPAIKNSRRNSAAKSRSGWVAAESQESCEELFFLAAWSPIRKKSRGPARFLSGCGISN